MRRKNRTGCVHAKHTTDLEATAQVVDGEDRHFVASNQTRHIASIAYYIRQMCSAAEINDALRG